MNRIDTTKYALAMFNCVVLAVLLFFIPLNSGTNIWLSLLIYILVLMCNVLYMAKDELKAKGQNRNTFENLGYMAIYVLEAVFIGFIIVKVLAMDSVQAQVQVDVKNFCDAYIYFFLFMLHMQTSILGQIAGSKGKRASFVPYLGIVLGIACAVPFYIELGADGIQVPNYVASIGFLAALPCLFRLRQMESYGHF